MRPIKILFITGWLWPWSTGGPGAVLMNLIKNLSLNPDYDITVYATVPSNERKNVYIYYPKNIKFKLMPTFWKADGFFDTVFTHLIYCVKILKDTNYYDIIHFNILPGLKSGMLPNTIRQFKKSRAKLILNFHGDPTYEARIYSESKLKNLGFIVHLRIARLIIT